jgi:hypothetical protein
LGVKSNIRSLETNDYLKFESIALESILEGVIGESILFVLRQSVGSTVRLPCARLFIIFFY